jgi:hypothetical protein
VLDSFGNHPQTEVASQRGDRFDHAPVPAFAQVANESPIDFDLVDRQTMQPRQG